MQSKAQISSLQVFFVAKANFMTYFVLARRQQFMTSFSDLNDVMESQSEIFMTLIALKNVRYCTSTRHTTVSRKNMHSDCGASCNKRPDNETTG